MKAKYGYWLFGEGLEKIRGYAAEGLDIAAVAEKIGVDRTTFARWCRRFPVLAELFCKDSESAEHDGENSDCDPHPAPYDCENSDCDPQPAAHDGESRDCAPRECDPHPAPYDSENSDCTPHPAEHDGESRDCAPRECDPHPAPYDCESRYCDPHPAPYDCENSDCAPHPAAPYDCDNSECDPHPAEHDGENSDCDPCESTPTTAFSYTPTDNKTCNYLEISGYPDNKTRNIKKTQDSGSTSESRRRADRLVENALLKRAVGYTVQEITRQPSKDTGELEITKIVEKDVMPSTAAQVFWLKNRCGWDADGVQSADEDECGGVVLLPPVDGD